MLPNAKRHNEIIAKPQTKKIIIKQIVLSYSFYVLRYTYIVKLRTYFNLNVSAGSTIEAYILFISITLSSTSGFTIFIYHVMLCC